MKKKFKRIGMVALLLMVTRLISSAYDFEKDGIYYNIISDKEVEVTFKSEDSQSYSGNVKIPALVNNNGKEYSVTTIGHSAFWQCEALTSVEIPNSVTIIDWGAFNSCTGLTSIDIPNSVTEIGGTAFCYCTGLTSIDIPNSVTIIGDGTFYGCTGLKSIDIPNSVTQIGLLDWIGFGAFSGCTGLTSIDIPNSVTQIGALDWDDSGAFSGCTGLTSVEISNSVTEIGTNAFSGCTGLTSIKIPNSVTIIGDEAFRGCTGLTSIEIPNSVTTIGYNTFYGCTGLTSIEIPNSVTTIGQGAFSGCTGLTSVEIPNSVTEIRGEAFWGCTGLTSIKIGNSVTKIEDKAFSGCDDLKSVTCLAKTPPELDYYVFYTASGSTLYVPMQSVEAYQNSSWNKYFDNIVGIEVFSGEIKAEDFEISKEESKDVDLSLDLSMESSYSGFQFDVEMPEGLSITDVKLSEALSASGFTATNSPTEGNPIRVVSYKTNGNGVTTTDGIVTLTVKADANATEGEKTISFTNVILSSPTGSDMPLDDSSVMVTVKGVPVSAINVAYSSGKQGELYVGESAVYVATVTPDNASDKSVTWSVADDTVVSIEEDDSDNSQVTVKGLKIGETTLKATANDGSEIEGTVTIKVVATPITSVSIESEDNKTSIYPEETLTLTASINPETATAPVTYKWESDNVAVATVEGNTANATLTGVTPGEANITVTATNAAGEVKSTAFKVTVGARPITSVTISEGTSIDKKVGEIFTLTAVVDPSNATNPVLSWSSDKPEIAKVVDGTVTPLAIGSAVITVTASNDVSEESASITVNVVATPASSITLDKTEATLKTTEELQLTATVLPAETTNKAITWTSSDATKATVDTEGNVKALQAGNVTITATVTDTPSVMATCEITIEELILGDANDDGKVTVSDVVSIVNYLNDLPCDNFCVIAANADQSTETATPESPKDPIDQNDVAVTVNMILAQVNSKNYRPFQFVHNGINVTDDKLLISERKESSFTRNIEIKLDATNEYVALMADIILPEGSTLETIETGAKAANHILSYNVVKGNLLKVVIYSMDNATLGNAESPLLTLRLGNVTTDEELNISFARISDSHFRRYALRAEHEDASGIDELISSEDGMYHVYNLNGVKVLTTNDRNELKQLVKGIYIINGQKVVVGK